MGDFLGAAIPFNYGCALTYLKKKEKRERPLKDSQKLEMVEQKVFVVPDLTIKDLLAAIPYAILFFKRMVARLLLNKKNC